MVESVESTRLKAEAAVEAIHEGALLIDVRSEAGRSRDGELQGAIVIAKPDVLHVLSERIRRVSDEQKIVIFCGSVKGSGPVVDTLTQAGFVGVYDVDGGFSALRDQGLSLIPRAAPAA
ncbi:rhodanese-like domain-containing protein [Rhizobium puerariae]|uniref:Rhodanese-like domain-containing protein n=1 Tax=Rhizobium puerariae TaxID=1585791 RepID=A0ABV6ADR5_9HYPH